jgi:transposase
MLISLFAASQQTMGNRRISPDLKECALLLWELGWVLELITVSLCISRASIYRWRDIFAECRSTGRPQSGLVGRPRILTRAVLTAIKEVYKSEADAYLDELVWWHAIHHDIAISRSALQKNSQDAGLTRKLMHKIAQERDEEARREFLEVMHDHSAGLGEEFVDVDEMSKSDHDTARRHGLSMSGERADFIENFVQGDRYSMVAAITTDGYIAMRVVLGLFDAVEFPDFITEQVVSSRFFGILSLVRSNEWSSTSSFKRVLVHLFVRN